MDQIRFEAGLGSYSISVPPESVGIFKGMGTHYFQIQLEVGIPQVGEMAGRLLYLETMLYAPQGSGPRVPLASANVSVPFNPEGEVRPPTLCYLITNAQLLALEQRRPAPGTAGKRCPAAGSVGFPWWVSGDRVHQYCREQMASAAGRAWPHAGCGDADPIP